MNFKRIPTFGEFWVVQRPKLRVPQIMVPVMESRHDMTDLTQRREARREEAIQKYGQYPVDQYLPWVPERHIKKSERAS